MNEALPSLLLRFVLSCLRKNSLLFCLYCKQKTEKYPYYAFSYCEKVHDNGCRWPPNIVLVYGIFHKAPNGTKHGHMSMFVSYNCIEINEPDPFLIENIGIKMSKINLPETRNRFQNAIRSDRGLYSLKWQLLSSETVKLSLNFLAAPR